ncbi:hypothetical protein NFJ02_11g06470 [Pycnococcus provasolii]
MARTWLHALLALLLGVAVPQSALGARALAQVATDVLYQKPGQTLQQLMDLSKGGYKCPAASTRQCRTKMRRHLPHRITQQCEVSEKYCEFAKQEPWPLVKRTRCGDIYPAPCDCGPNCM